MCDRPVSVLRLGAYGEASDVVHALIANECQFAMNDAIAATKLAEQQLARRRSTKRVRRDLDDLFSVESSDE